MRFNVPFLCAVGIPTDDGRTFDAWENRDLPLTLLRQTSSNHGQGEFVLAGSIVEIGTPVNGVVPGVIDTDDGSEAGIESARLIREQIQNGISVDFTCAEEDIEVVCTEEDEEGFCISAELRFARATIAAATIVSIPAWSQARIDPAPLDAPEDAPAPVEPVAGSGRTSIAPGQRQRLSPFRVRSIDIDTSGPVVASAGTLLAPPAAWFADPLLDRYTPLSVTDDGQVFGHVAPWDACHIGFSDRCVTPPRSSAGYGHFCTGRREALGSNGERTLVPTGVLTIGAEHAPVRGPGSSAAEAIDHYAHTACAVADVAAGEDAYGIWIAGALRPDVTESMLVALRGSAPSGDWRRIGGRYEMVGVLCVNTPGFRQPDAMAASASVQVGEDALVIVSPRGPVVAGAEPCGCGESSDADVVARVLGPEARRVLRDRLTRANNSHPFGTNADGTTTVHTATGKPVTLKVVGGTVGG